MNEIFSITAHLETEIIVRNTTLDALIAGVLVEQGMAVEDAHRSIPIKCVDGLFHASCSRYDGVVHRGKRSFTACMRAQHDIDIDWVERKPNGAIKRKIGLQRRADCGNVMSTYEVTHCPSVTWHAEGDPEHVLELLEKVLFIGKRRASGYGQVRDWELSESSLGGLIDEDGLPLRPIPLEMWSGSREAIRADVAWKPAYWHHENRAICVVPQSFAGGQS